MKKLTLKLDDLRVETFTTASEQSARGTVQGHYGTAHTQPVQQSCGDSCEMTCGTIPPGQLACVYC